MDSRQAILLIFIGFYMIINATKDFGITKVHVDTFETCNGPKRMDCSVCTVSIDGPSKISMRLIVTENVRITHGRIVGYTQGKEVLKFPVKKPCANVLIRTIFKQLMNMSDDCTVMKGAFDLLVTKFDQCKGPKRKECAIAVVKINNQYNLDYEITIKDNVRPTKGKIIVYAKGKETLRLQVKDPCQHLFLKPLLQSMLNVTSDCLIIKGHYHFNVDIQDVARKYYGGEFLFGNWTFKSVFYNDVCTFSCSVIEVSIVPKGKH